MRYLAILLLLYSATAVPEAWEIDWWPGEFGTPCTTATDRRELADAGGICEAPNLTPPKWGKKSSAKPTKPTMKGNAA